MAKGLKAFWLLLFRILLLLAFLHVFAPLPAFAGTSTTLEDDSADDTGEGPASAAETAASDSLKALQKTEVVYGASSSEEKTTEAPGSMTIITSTEIKVGGFRTLDDLLNYVRGFYVNYDRDYSYVGLRGFGSLGGYNSRVLLLVDGHRINDNVYGQFYSGEEGPVDIDMVDHVEIIRGPASVLYGSSAVFGVINVVTKKGKDIKGVELTAQGGSLDSLGGGVLAGAQEKGGFQWSAQGSAYTSGGYSSLYFPAYDTPSNNVNNGIAQNSDGENAQHAYFSMGLDDWSMETAFMHRYKVVPTGVYGTQFDNPGTNTDDINYFGEVDYRHGDPESGAWFGRLYVDVSNYWGNYLAAGPGPLNVDVGLGSWAGSELMYSFKPFESNKLTVGGTFIDNFRQYQENYNVGAAPVLDDYESSTEWALYAEDGTRLFSTLYLSLGGRFDYFSVPNVGEFVPRGALIYTPSPSSVLKFVAGEAFRAPGPYELFYQDGGLSEEANPSLVPETFDTYEFDWEQVFLTEHRGLLSLYRYVGHNLILGTQDPNNPNLLIYENVGHISINGLEAEYQYQNAGGVQGRLSFSWQRAQDDISGNVLPDSPQVLGKANLQVPIDARLLTVAGEAQFTGASYGYTGVWAPDYLIFNLKLYSPHFLWDNVEANLDFYNLFNTPYYDPVSNALMETTLQQDGLVIWAHIGYRL